MTDQDLLEILREFAVTLHARGAVGSTGARPGPDTRPSEPQAESAVGTENGATGGLDRTGTDGRISLPNRLMTVLEVAEYLGVTRSTVDQMPFAILPFADISPTHKRQHKRFDPRDVAALPARLRAWDQARRRGEGERFLKEAERALRERDAEDMRRGMEWEVAA